MKEKTFSIGRIAAEPQPLSMPALPIREYPPEQGACRPFAQGRLCFCPGGLYVQLTAFEAKVPPTSALAAAFAFPPSSPQGILALTVSPEKTFWQTFGSGAGREIPGPPVHLFRGEDLQGVYWGGETLVPRQFLRELGFPAPEELRQLRGNLFKTCRDAAHRHMGSLFPMGRGGEELFSAEHLGLFQVVDY